jgi:hypothetical protein
MVLAPVMFLTVLWVSLTKDKSSVDMPLSRLGTSAQRQNLRSRDYAGLGQVNPASEGGSPPRTSRSSSARR